MKRILLVIHTLFIAISTFAQFNGDGYYRVKNVGSGRYITVRDNRGSIDIASTSADLGAVELFKGFENVVSDPSSILYIDETSSGFKFYAQGTDTYQIIGYYLKLRQNADGSYKAYQGNSMMEMYLGDKVTSSSVKGRLATTAKGTHRDWYILPFNASGNDNYFGLTPEVNANGTHYASFYASFPFSIQSNGLKVYYIAKVDRDMAVYKEVVDGKVPAATPVFFKCVSDKPADNRLNIAANSSSAFSDNKLGGVYFDNDNSAHYNRTAYNGNTMRVLSTTTDGKLAFVKSNLEFLPANRSYLVVPSGSPDVIKVLSEDEYKKIIDQEQKTYTVTFKIGNQVVSTQTLTVGAKIDIPTAPAKEGYTFSGWGDVPATMPAKDLTFEGTYKINYYTLTFKVGDEVISTQSLAYGASIKAPTAPSKQGYTFSGWVNVPATMPAKNLTVEGAYTANSYKLTFVIGDEIIFEGAVTYGSPITAPAAPAKEGYTFGGWDNVPATMPAEDIVVEGSYTVNYYTLVFKAGEEVIYEESLAYGSPITAPTAPAKEGYTFGGWENVPATMPAKDITFEGAYTINYYTLTFKIDDEVIYEESLAYGSIIVVPEVSEREGYNFSGWGEVPATMPAKNLTIIGVYVEKDSYTVTFKLDDEIVSIQTLTEGDSISIPEVSDKEGYTFGGWGDVPATMPAENIIIIGKYIPKQYKVIFKIGAEVISSQSLPYGTVITPPEAPEKEGHTFSGWGDVLETVPAYNVTFYGRYAVNRYTIQYKVDGKNYQKRTVEYGTPISLIAVPEKENRPFSGWSEVPETMPAADLEVTGTFMYYVYYYEGDDLVHTEELYFGESIPEFAYSPIDEEDTFLGWLGETYDSMPAHDITYTANIQQSVEVLTSDMLVDVYTLTGAKVLAGVSLGEAKEVLKRGIYIVNGRKMFIE
jgi:hypothetical protein